jgi:IS5 family transposase
MTKLTDGQINVLSGAAQREDGAATLPEGMKPASLAKLSQALIAQELVREVRTKPKMPVWRRDAARRPLSLVITRAGKAAIESREEGATRIFENAAAKRGVRGVSKKVAEAPGAKANQKKVRREGVQDVKKKLAPSWKKRTVSATSSEGQASPSPLSWRPRAGSKQALLISLLMSAEGASLDKIVAATGWLPHSVRAALTGLRKRDHAIERLREAGGKNSTYRIVTNAQPIAA